MALAIVLLIPLVVAVAGFFLFHHSVSWKEFLLQVLVSGLFALAGWQVAKWGSLQDTENLNGRITQKISGTQKCCHCHDVCTGRDKDGNCTSSVEVCSHSQDHYWDLATSVGNISIESCDGWGSPPAAWSQASVGDPASVSHNYTNYLYADEDSLMRHAPMEKFQELPEYPRVHNFYYVDHVVANGVSVPHGWQERLREINAELGHSNQVDVTVVLTSQQDPTFAQALEAKWVYGPKNSLNIVMGVKNSVIQWVRVVTFSKVAALKVELRDKLQGLPLSDPTILPTIHDSVKARYKRTSMADFEYLAAAAHPRGWGLAILVILQLLVSIGVAYWAHTHDIFGDEAFHIRSR